MCQRTWLEIDLFSSREITFPTAAILGLLAGLVAVFALRAPISPPLQDLDLHRQLLAGSDALLERMVIPPNRPDWLLMDCADSASRGNSAYDQVRRGMCETAHKSSSTQLN